MKRINSRLERCLPFVEQKPQWVVYERKLHRFHSHPSWLREVPVRIHGGNIYNSPLPPRPTIAQEEGQWAMVQNIPCYFITTGSFRYNTPQPWLALRLSNQAAKVCGLQLPATWKEFWYGTGTSFCTLSQSRLDFCPTFPALGFRLLLLLPTLWWTQGKKILYMTVFGNMLHFLLEMHSEVCRGEMT